MLLLLVLVLPLLEGDARHPDCFERAHHALKNNLTKQCKVVDYAEKLNRWQRPLPVRWLVVDAELGVVRILFPLLYGVRGVASYTVSLMVNETVITQDECKLTSTFNVNREEIHTKTTFYPQMCRETLPDDGVPKGLEVEFKFVFSGCYRLKVAPKGNPNNMSANQLLHTNYIKDILESPNVTRNLYQNKLTISYGLGKTWPRNFRLKVKNNENTDDQLQRYVWVMVLHPDVGSEICEPNSTEVKSPNCKYEVDGLTCEFFNLGPGNYCFTAEVLNDIRCTYGNVWKLNKCLWNTPIVIGTPEYGPSATTSLDDRVVQMSTDSVWYFLGPVLAICVVLGLVLYGYRLHRKPTYVPRDHSDSTTSFKIQARTKVVLLYPQDCQPFMEMMATFRSVLGKVAMCEVYDVFDASLLNEVASGPQEWLRHLIQQQDTMVVVMETHCAVLHQRALELGRFSLQYLQPLPNNRLFLYGLQTVCNSLQGDLYSRNFVVRFKGFSEDNEGLCHLTPYRRFTIPTHLSNLVNSLKDSYTINPEDYDLADLKEVKELYCSLENVVLYKERFPNYLTNLLVRSSTTADTV